MANITLEQLHKNVTSSSSDGGAYFTPAEAAELQRQVEEGGLTVAEIEEFGNLQNLEDIHVYDSYFKTNLSVLEISHYDIFTLILKKAKESAPIQSDLSTLISNMELNGTYNLNRCGGGVITLTGRNANLQIQLSGFYNGGRCDDDPSALGVTAFMDGKYIRLDEASMRTLANTYNAWASKNNTPQLSESFQLMPDFAFDLNPYQKPLTEKIWSGINAFWTNSPSDYISKSNFITLQQNREYATIVQQAKGLWDRFDNLYDVSEYEQLKAKLLEIHKKFPELASTYPIPSLTESAKTSYQNHLKPSEYRTEGTYQRVYKLGIAGDVDANEVLKNVFIMLFNDKIKLFIVDKYTTHPSNFTICLRELNSLPPQGAKLASNYTQFSNTVDAYLSYTKTKNYDDGNVASLEEIKKYLAQ